MEQCKGYLRLKGKVWGLNNKESKTNDTGSMNSLTFKINTNKDNSLFVQVGKWTNSSLSIKIKGEGMEKPEEFNEQEAIGKIKKLFKDGDSVYINCRADINTFSKRVDYLVSQIYIEKEPIDFDSEDFEEVNELSIPVIVTEKVENDKVKVGIADYKGKMVELELSLSDEDVKNYFTTNVKVGDLLKTSIEVINKPNYVEGASEPTGERKTLKGKTIGGGNSNGNRKIDGFINKLEVVDIDLDKSVSRKYTREEIREALEESQNNNYTSKKDKETNVVDDSDLPF